MDKNLNDVAKNCQPCQLVKSRIWPERPWQRVHINFVGHQREQCTFCYSGCTLNLKWPEVVGMKTTTAAKII